MHIKSYSSARFDVVGASGDRTPPNANSKSSACLKAEPGRVSGLGETTARDISGQMTEAADEDAERFYVLGLREIESLLEGDRDDAEALAVKADLEEGLAGLRGRSVAAPPLASPEPQPAVAIGPALPSSAAAAKEETVSRPPKRQRTVTSVPSNNARMHPGTGYAEQEPDFAQLAADDAQLTPFVRLLPSGSAKVDFRDAEASKAVTTALLRRDCGVRWALPPGQLIPPVPGRANYIAWIADLLALSRPEGAVVGLDIGCGASLIYPLLGAAQHGWRFVAADITDAAIDGAHANVALNPHLKQLIEVRDVRKSLPTFAQLPPSTQSLQEVLTSARPDILGSRSFPNGILGPALQPGESFAFCMCNPPFFESLDQAGLNPHTAHGGTAEEMVCPGGEAAFVGAMVADSLELRHRVHWFTSMVGRKASLKALRTALYRHCPTALRTTEFAQGRTSRWGLAWSFEASQATNSQPLVRQPQPQQLALSFPG